MIPAGLLIAVILPDFSIAALHITFIGGFGVSVFGVATHVSLSHLGMEKLALGRPWPVVVIALTFALAALTRVLADAADTYFEHLGWAAALWLIGSAPWLTFFGRRFWTESQS